jgi:Bacterial TSP3 repeat
MKLAQFLERLAGSTAIVACGLVVSANEGCLQKEVDFAPSANVQTTGTPTQTPTGGDDGDDDGLTTPTPTPTSGTPTVTPTVTPTTSESEDPDDNTGAALSEGTGSESDAADNGGLLLELSKLSSGGAASQRSGAGSNWLGEAFRSGDGEGSAQFGLCADSDGDGFIDQAEVGGSTDSHSADSTPPRPATKLADRFRGIDTDMDGLGNAEDPDPTNADSDGDGRPDGAELLSGGNIQDPNDTYPDDDGDGLSNEFEERRGTNPLLKDTDGDGLDDAREFAIGSNPNVCDTDGDGFTDGAEVNRFGSDPTRGESAIRK